MSGDTTLISEVQGMVKASNKSDMQMGMVYDVSFPFVKGGGQRRFYEIGRRMAKSGWHVDWMTFQSWEGSPTIFHQGMNYIGIGRAPNLYNTDGKRSKLEPLIFAFNVLLRLRHFKKYDLLWVGQWPLLHILPMMFACHIFRIPLVVDWWEVWTRESWIKESKAIGWVGYFIQTAFIRLIAKYAFIVTESNLEAGR